MVVCNLGVHLLDWPLSLWWLRTHNHETHGRCDIQAPTVYLPLISPSPIYQPVRNKG